MNIWDKIKHFTPKEFEDPNYGGSGENIDEELLLNLEELRDVSGWPIIPHSVDDFGNKLGGCVDIDGRWGHSDKSYHLFVMGCKACDFHFNTTSDPRLQYKQVELMQFTGIGVYYDWHWNGKLLAIGFHVDRRPEHRIQRWARRNGEYFFLLGREN